MNYAENNIGRSEFTNKGTTNEPAQNQPDNHNPGGINEELPDKKSTKSDSDEDDPSKKTEINDNPEETRRKIPRMGKN